MTFLEALDELILNNACIQWEGYRSICLIRGANETVLEISWRYLVPYDFSQDEIIGNWNVIPRYKALFEAHGIYS